MKPSALPLLPGNGFIRPALSSAGIRRHLPMPIDPQVLKLISINRCAKMSSKAPFGLTLI